MKLPKDQKFQEACSLIKTLQNKGFDAYLAGGCVRDLILGALPHDYDISTSAKPNEIETIFKKTKPIGKQFGVILVIGKKGHFEVSTFRGEDDYQDFRRPKKVFWVKAEEDAKRRDFTINGLFYDPIKNRVFDFVDGQTDIKKKIVRFIGDADERIKEDHLRILRAIRFKNVLNFSYEEKTQKAILKNTACIKTVSKERIKDELDKILADKSRVKGIMDLSNFQMLPHILLEVEEMKKADQPARYHAEGNVFVHTMLALEKLPFDASKEVAWAVLLHDVGKPEKRREIIHPKYGERTVFYGHVEKSAEIAEKICKRLKFSKKERDEVVFLVAEHMRHKDIVAMRVARQRQWLAHPLIEKLFLVWKADGEGSWLGKKDNIDLSLYNGVKKLYEAEKKRPKPPKLLLSGYEVMEILKIPSGPKVGQVLKKLIDAQLEEKVKTKPQAQEFIKGI